jgi:hypothetical protein
MLYITPLWPEQTVVDPVIVPGVAGAALETVTTAVAVPVQPLEDVPVTV